MKIRNGFVSNSSSSSFLVYGASIDKQEVNKKLKNIFMQNKEQMIELSKKQSQTRKYWKHFDNPEELYEYMSEDGPAEFIGWFSHLDCEECKALCSLGVYGSCSWTELFIGSSWDNVADEETGGEFKSKIQNAIKTVFGDIECSTHEKTWYD